jgi:uncharacterized protein involved in exopolysaccharide biosynthesis
MSKIFELMQQVPGRREELRREIIQPNTAIAPRSQATQASARIAIEAFCRQWKLFFGASVTVLLLTLLITVTAHKEYESQMKFLVQNARENVVVTPERTNGTNAVSDVTEAQVNSELEILHSHDVMDQIADPDWAAVASSPRTISAVHHHEALLSSFEKRFQTEIVRKTNVINVSIVAGTPEQAKSELEHLAVAYLAEHRRLQRPAGASEFFVSEAEHARKAWDDATQHLVRFQQDHQLLSVPDRASFLDEQISEDENEIFTTDSTLHEMDVQLAEGSHRLQEIPSRHLTQQITSPDQAAAQQLETRIVDLENKRTSLLANYKATDRSVVELDQQIATVKAALNDAKASSSQEETTDVDPAWQQVRTNYVQNQITRQSLAKHRAGLEAHVNQLKTELANLQGETVQFNNLEAQADELKENYQLYLQKRDQTQIEDAMDEHKLLNVAVAQQPTLSYAPVRPKPITNALLGTVTAIFLGLCVVYFAEVGRNTIAAPRELDGISNYPVLATVPRMAALDAVTIRSELERVKEEIRV